MMISIDTTTITTYVLYVFAFPTIFWLVMYLLPQIYMAGKSTLVLFYDNCVLYEVSVVWLLHSILVCF